MMCAMDTWKRLGTSLKAAAKSRGLRQQDVADRLGRQRNAIRNIETGQVRTLTDTIRSYAELVGWTRDSPELVLAGGEPVLVSPPGDSTAVAVEDALTSPAAAEKAGLDDLGLAVIQSLGEGRLVGTQVWTRPVAGTRMRMTVVARLDTDAAPEDERAAAADWMERGEVLRRAVEGDDPKTDE